MIFKKFDPEPSKEGRTVSILDEEFFFLVLVCLAAAARAASTLGLASPTKKTTKEASPCPFRLLFRKFARGSPPASPHLWAKPREGMMRNSVTRWEATMVGIRVRERGKGKKRETTDQANQVRDPGCNTPGKTVQQRIPGAVVFCLDHPQKTNG
jgi:hypothetical protein